MKTTSRIAMMSVLTWLALGGGAKGDLIYNIVAYPSITHGDTVTGTITTNETTGTNIPVQAITAWNITVAIGAVPLFTLTPTNSFIPGGSFNATTQAITIPVTGVPTGGIAFVSNGLNADISWHTFGPTDVLYEAHYLGGQLWLQTLPTPNSPVATATAVPEPSAAVLALIGAGTVIACGLVRKRRGSRTATIRTSM
jgi:hypothetical protein